MLSSPALPKFYFCLQGIQKLTTEDSRTVQSCGFQLGRKYLLEQCLLTSGPTLYAGICQSQSLD
uniref:Uncharacterized protein n=1 Tax=Anguilla anguilla TaxID=7936 RepID=A0A0E9X8Z6_ANGAN